MKVMLTEEIDLPLFKFFVHSCPKWTHRQVT